MILPLRPMRTVVVAAVLTGDQKVVIAAVAGSIAVVIGAAGCWCYFC